MKVARRDLLRVGALSWMAGLWPGRAGAASYRVGIARGLDPYGAAMRAIDAAAEWPGARIAGRTVIIKPNLVAPRSPDSGAVTDPEVVRALVDRALRDGAAAVWIVEASPRGAHFGGCGYDFFAKYDVHGRVRLVDLQLEPTSLVPLARPLAYPAVHLADVLLRDDVVFISAAKLKTHGDAVMSLSMKNLFGLPAVDKYLSNLPAGRFAMHDRGVHLTIPDLARLRPIDFAVVDGVWAMEGNGPLSGTPVRLGVVLAGANAVAVDRVSTAAAGVSQRAVRHLDYAAAVGLGPADLDAIVVAGDALPRRPLQMPTLPPFVEYPKVFPASFNPSRGQKTVVAPWYSEPSLRRLEIRRLADDVPDVQVIRTLRPWAVRGVGYEIATWDGRADDGSLAAPGLYAAHVRAYHTNAEGRPLDGIGWIAVQEAS